VQIASFDTHSNYTLRLYWLNDASSRAYFVSGVEQASTPTEALQRLVHPDFPFRSRVILQNSRIGPRKGEAGAGTAKIIEHHSGRVLCEVEAGMPGFLVLLDSYYPGWQAYVDGKRVEILRANYVFRAVEVQAGNHHV